MAQLIAWHFAFTIKRFDKKICEKGKKTHSQNCIKSVKQTKKGTSPQNVCCWHQNDARNTPRDSQIICESGRFFGTDKSMAMKYILNLQRQYMYTLHTCNNNFTVRLFQYISAEMSVTPDIDLSYIRNNHIPYYIFCQYFVTQMR